MSQVLLYFVLHCVGVSTCLGFGLGRRPLLACAIGFAIGLSVMVTVVLGLLLLHVPYTVFTGTATAALIIGGGLYAASRRDAATRATRADWIRIAWWSAAFLVLLLPIAYVNLTLLSFDSHYQIILGRAILEDHALHPEIVMRLTEYGAFHALAESGVGFTRETYLYSLTPVLGLTTLAAFAAVLWHGLAALQVAERRRGLWIALVTATTFTVYMMWRHFFYIHNNLATATYMFLTLALFWVAEVERDVRLLPLAFAALISFSLCRIENPIIATVFLALIIPTSRLPARALLVGLAVHAAAITAWFLHLSMAAPDTAQFLTPMKCYATIAIVLALLIDVAALFALRWSWLETLNRRLPQLIAAVVVIATVLAFTDKSDYMWTNADTWYQNLFRSSYWGHVWYAIGAIALIGLFAPAPPAGAVFVYGLPVYFVLNLLFVYGRTPFRLAIDDSASRMAVHLVPVCFFYFGVKFIPLLIGASPPRTE